jgi:hypothetical protein
MTIADSVHCGRRAVEPVVVVGHPQVPDVFRVEEGCGLPTNERVGIGTR